MLFKACCSKLTLKQCQKFEQHALLNSNWPWFVAGGLVAVCGVVVWRRSGHQQAESWVLAAHRALRLGSGRHCRRSVLHGCMPQGLRVARDGRRARPLALRKSTESESAETLRRRRRVRHFSAAQQLLDSRYSHLHPIDFAPPLKLCHSLGFFFCARASLDSQKSRPIKLTILFQLFINYNIPLCFFNPWRQLVFYLGWYILKRSYQ